MTHAAPAPSAGAPRTDALLRAGPLLIVPRRLDPRVAAALDDADCARAAPFRFRGDLGALATAAAASLARAGGVPRWLARWLADDIAAQARLLLAFTGAPAVEVRVDVGGEAPGFHLDPVRFRLVTAYRGRGPEWVSPRAAFGLAPGEAPPPGAVRRLDRGTVAILRGAAAATSEAPGVLHRAAPGQDGGLMLAIDEAGRLLH